MKKTPHAIFRFIVRLILNIIARVEMSGFEHLPPGQGYVIAANHIGRLDAALAYYLLDRPDIIMVVAEKYKNTPFSAGWSGSRTGCSSTGTTRTSWPSVPPCAA